MKKALLLFLFCTASVLSRGQSIALNDFYVPSTTWTEAWKWDLYGYHMGSGTTKLMYRIERDTVFSGKTWHLLAVSEAGSYTSSTFSPATPSFKIIGRIRTDSNIVYFTQDFYLDAFQPLLVLGHEYKLYDFNISASSPTVDTTNLLFRPTVVGIDSVMLSNGTTIPRYSATNVSWLYGVGSGRGFLPEMYWGLRYFGPGPSSDGEYTLCYENPSFNYHFQYTSDFLYGNFENNCFDWNTLGVTSLSTDNRELTFYPDPITTEISFKGTGADDVAAISITDMMGNEVAQFSKPRKEQPLQLQLPAGVYVVHALLNDGSSINRRVVKL